MRHVDRARCRHAWYQPASAHTVLRYRKNGPACKAAQNACGDLVAADNAVFGWYGMWSNGQGSSMRHARLHDNPAMPDCRASIRTINRACCKRLAQFNG